MKNILIFKILIIVVSISSCTSKTIRVQDNLTGVTTIVDYAPMELKIGDTIWIYKGIYDYQWRVYDGTHIETANSNVRLVTIVE